VSVSVTSDGNGNDNDNDNDSGNDNDNDNDRDLLQHPSDRSLRASRSQWPATQHCVVGDRSFTRPSCRRDESSPAVGVAGESDVRPTPPKVSYGIVPPKAYASKGWMAALTLQPGGASGGSDALGAIRSMLEPYRAVAVAL
jgi:hypothetical protein